MHGMQSFLQALILCKLSTHFLGGEIRYAVHKNIV